MSEIPAGGCCCGVSVVPHHILDPTHLPYWTGAKHMHSSSLLPLNRCSRLVGTHSQTSRLGKRQCLFLPWGGILGRRPVPVPTGSHNPSAKLSTFGCYFCSPRLLLSHSPHTVGPLLFQAPFGITYLFFSLTWTSIEDLYGFLPHPISWMGNAPVSTSMYLCTIATKCQRGGHPWPDRQGMYPPYGLHHKLFLTDAAVARTCCGCAELVHRLCTGCLAGGKSFCNVMNTLSELVDISLNQTKREEQT
jgi:hypothetical protein